MNVPISLLHFQRLPHILPRDRCAVTRSRKGIEIPVRSKPRRQLCRARRCHPRFPSSASTWKRWPGSRAVRSSTAEESFLPELTLRPVPAAASRAATHAVGAAIQSRHSVRRGRGGVPSPVCGCSIRVCSTNSTRGDVTDTAALASAGRAADPAWRGFRDTRFAIRRYVKYQEEREPREETERRDHDLFQRPPSN